MEKPISLNREVLQEGGVLEIPSLLDQTPRTNDQNGTSDHLSAPLSSRLLQTAVLGKRVSPCLSGHQRGLSCSRRCSARTVSARHRSNALAASSSPTKSSKSWCIACHPVR
jgi:hypothetical protein